MPYSDRGSAYDFLAGLLPKSQHRKIEQILNELVDLDPARVEIARARVPVDRVMVGGLEIELDANGNAVSVTFPSYMGAEVTECWPRQ